LDISSSREILGIASYVDMSLLLVDTDVVHPHTRWEGQMGEVNVTKVFGYAQVDDDILKR